MDVHGYLSDDTVVVAAVAAVMVAGAVEVEVEVKLRLHDVICTRQKPTSLALCIDRLATGFCTGHTRAFVHCHNPTPLTKTPP